MARSALFAFLLFIFSVTLADGQILELNPAAEELPQPSEVTFDRDLRVETDTPTIAESENDSSPLPPPTPRPPAATEEQPTAEAKPAASTKTLPVVEVRGNPIERGPIHEAFAEPLQLTPKPTKVLKKAPPAIIEEMAPESPKDAKNMQWISGYWAWDEQRTDYVWVSGVWRKIPRGRTWVPGSWQQAEGGHQWVPGAWLETAPAGGEIADQEVLPAPPNSLEQGPTSPAPSANHFWVPGVWQRNTVQKYVWRPGFWSQTQKNWVWVPDHYVWSPTGCRYVSGYWDYTWERRGTLYAPCTFASTSRVGRLCYTPTKVIDTNQWLSSLWVAPSYSHYYYGDYYDCVDQGYSPWYSYYGANRSCYDPFYSYYRWQFPSVYGIGLYSYLDGLHNYYRRNPTFRPNISFYGYNNWPRTRTYSSIYGNVPQLYGYLGLGTYENRLRSGYGRSNIYDRYRDVYRSVDPYDRFRDYGRGYEYRSGYGSRSDYGYRDERGYRSGYYGNRSGYNGLGINDILRSQRPDRSRSGNKGSISKGSNSGVKRPDVGAYDRNRSKPIPTNRVHQSPHRQQFGPARPQSRPNPQVTQRPQQRPQSRPQTRPQSRPQSKPQTLSQSRPQPRPQVKPQARPPVTRSSSPKRSPGFSTHSMKKARGADLAKQRAAMQKWAAQRKGK